MATDASKVLVGTPDQKVTGAIMSAPVGTPLPQTIDDQLDQAFIQGDSGYVSSDGLTLTPDASTTDINEWGGALVRRVLETFTGTLAWSYIQTSLAELRNTFGDNNVEVTAPATAEHGEQIRVSVGARLPERKSWIFRMKDGNARIMIVVPDGQPTSWDDITFAATDAVAWPISLATYPDEQGNSIYILLDDGRSIGVSTVHPTGVTVTPATASVEEGKTIQLTASVQPATATDRTVTWTSDHSEIASVSDTGLVTGVKAPADDTKATITATTRDGGKTATSVITVTAPAPAQHVYYGVNASNAAATYTETVVKALTAKTVTGSAAGDYSYTPDATANNGNGTYDVFALPASYPAPTFQTGGFPAPFTKLTTVTVDNVSCDVWISDNAFTDAHSIKVS